MLESTSMSTFLPSVAVDRDLPGLLAVIAGRRDMTVPALVRDILTGYTEGYMAHVPIGH